MITQNTQNTKKIAVGMSGGVDSCVAALLLKKQGHDVVGFFMKNWDDEDANCSAKDDLKDVERVCAVLNIPFYSVDFVKEYYENVFEKFINESKQGLTPNPDILCNKEIKFKALINQTLALGMDYLATGHYAGVDYQNSEYQLLKGKDSNKDQSYFLYTLGSKVLKNVLFPLEKLEKQEVRKIALENKLPVFDKKDSTGICFVGERKFKPFLMKYIKPKIGNMVNLAGKSLGKHDGLSFYTIGQRKGLGLGGPGEPYFVVDKKIKDNILIVERGLNHPALFRNKLRCDELHFVNDQSKVLMLSNDAKSFKRGLRAKIRYRQKDQLFKVINTNIGNEANSKNNYLEVEFESDQRAMTMGQAIVFYDGDICLGGATIRSLGPNNFETMNKAQGLSHQQV
jgi:tRNA-uridine 2-sulfurtransferase